MNSEAKINLRFMLLSILILVGMFAVVRALPQFVGSLDHNGTDDFYYDGQTVYFFANVTEVNATNMTLGGPSNISINCSYLNGTIELVVGTYVAGDNETDTRFMFTCPLDYSNSELGATEEFEDISGGNFTVIAVNSSGDGYGGTAYMGAIIAYNHTRPASPDPFMRFSDNTTDLSQEDDFNDVNFIIEMQINGSILPGPPWSDFATVMRLNFSSVNLSDPNVGQQFAALPSAVEVNISPSYSGESRIFLNSTALSAFNTRATLTMYKLPFTSMPSILTDTGSVNTSISMIYDYGGGFGTLTFVVDSFSEYNITDNTTAIINITSPVNDTNYSVNWATISVLFNGTGSPIDNDTIWINLTGEESYNYTNLSNDCIATSTETVLCTFNATSLSDARHNISAAAEDYGENGVVEVNGYFITDTTAPTTSLNGTSVASISAGQPVYVYANWTDVTTGVQTIELILNGTVVSQTNTTGLAAGSEATYNFTYLTSTSQIGETLNFTINATDYVGNEASTSLLQVSVLDSIAPNITLNVPADEYKKSADYNSSHANLPTLNFTAIDNYDANLSCNITHDGVNIQLVNNVTSGVDYLHPLNTGAEAVYLWNVTCWDAQGNTNISNTFRYTVDVTPPWYDVTYFAAENISNTTPTAGDMIGFATNWTDSLLNVDKVVWYIDGTAVNISSIVSDGVAINLTWTIPSNYFGVYATYVWANDTVGNSNQTDSITINISDAAAPVINLTTPSNNSVINATTSISGTITDNTGLTNCNYSIDGGTYVNLTTPGSAPDFTYSIASNFYSNGTTHNITIICADSSSNLNTVSPEFVWTVNDTTAPSVSSSSPSGEQSSGTTSVLLSVTVNEYATGCKYGTTDTSFASLSNTMTGTNATTFTASVSVSDGNSYTYYVRCNDTAGNIMNTSSSISFSVASATTTQTTGGGGGVVTAAPSIEGVSTSHSWDVVNPEAPVTMTVNKAEIPVSKITVDVKNKVTNIEVSIGELTEAPTTDEVLTTPVFKYMQIEKARITNEDIDSVEIEFKVEKSWLTENNIAEDDVLLVRYNGEWSELPTEKLLGDTGYAYYKATAPGLSYFAVTAKGAIEEQIAEGEVEEIIPPVEEVAPPLEEAAPPVEAPPVEEVASPVEEAPAPIEEVVPPEAKKPYSLIILLAIIIIGLVAYYIYTGKKK